MHPDQQSQRQFTASDEERTILEAIRRNPALKRSIGKTIEDFNEEVGKGMNELEAEILVTKMVKNIGVNLIKDWATQSQDGAIEEALRSNHQIKRGKKNVPGIPPLE